MQNTHPKEEHSAKKEEEKIKYEELRHMVLLVNEKKTRKIHLSAPLRLTEEEEGTKHWLKSSAAVWSWNSWAIPTEPSEQSTRQWWNAWWRYAASETSPRLDPEDPT